MGEHAATAAQSHVGPALGLDVHIVPDSERSRTRDSRCGPGDLATSYWPALVVVIPPGTVERNSGLNNSLNVLCGWPRQWGRKPITTAWPLPTCTCAPATRPAT